MCMRQAQTNKRSIKDGSAAGRANDGATQATFCFLLRGAWPRTPSEAGACCCCCCRHHH